jgi:hypothetical protein
VLHADLHLVKPGHEDLLVKMRNNLAERANGMYVSNQRYRRDAYHFESRFVWVKIWMDILLPVNNPRHVVQGEDFARTLLDQMIDSAGPTHTSINQLKVGYRRLWDRNNLSGFQEIRVRLFRLVFCAFMPLSALALTQALRIQFGEKESYDESLTVEQVKVLGANFLTENDAGMLGFWHDSARQFVSTHDFEESNDLVGSNRTTFDMRRNHRFVAMLYIQIIKVPSHPIWEASRVTGARIRTWVNTWQKTYIWKMSHRELHPFMRDTRIGGGLTYLLQYGLQHCKHAAEKTSIFDDVWMDLFDEIIKVESTKFALSVSASVWPQIELSWLRVIDMAALFQIEADTIKLRPLSILAWLDILAENDFSDTQLRNLGGFPSGFSVHERRLALFLEEPRENINKDSTLQHALLIASQRRSAITTKFLLDSTRHRYRAQAALDMLSAGNANGLQDVVAQAIVFRRIEVLQALLGFEKQMMDELNKGDNAVSQSVPRPIQQWSRFAFNLTHLQLAIRHLEESSVCDLLHDFPPHDVDLKGKDGVTALHKAAERGKLRLIQQLVEQHNATLDAQDDHGLTPEMYASILKSNACFSYLQKKREEANLPLCQVSDEVLERQRERIFESEKQRAIFSQLASRKDRKKMLYLHRR